MHRSGLFWKLLLPAAALIVVAALTADFLPPGATLPVLAAVLIAAALHARWITQQVKGAAGWLSESIERLGTGNSGSEWSDGHAAELAPLVAAVNGLRRRLNDHVATLEREGIEQADSSALWEVVLRTMIEGVVVIDRSQRVLFANEAARPLLDVQTSDVVGRPLWELSRLSPVGQIVERVLETDRSAEGEYDIPRTKCSVAITATPLPREPLPAVMLVLHDVTELRRLESLRRDFVSNVSHELKTPLTSIQAYADTLLEGDFEDPDECRHFLSKIIEQSERLGELILDIIRLGKIESRPEVFDVRPVPVHPVVAACLEAHAKVAEASGIELASEHIPEDVAVLADAGELRTILDNLIDNALNYTPRGGNVVVRLADEGDGGLVGIVVADTGIGIPKNQRRRVFERFHRVDRARDRQRGGTGLGLSIVKHLCQLFGGRIELDSELGVGSTFTVWLPCADGAAPRERAEVAVDSQSG